MRSLPDPASPASEAGRLSSGLLLLTCLLLSGCATAGPNHVYVTAAGDPAVHDLSASGRATLPALAEGEHVLGLAYDFNTDHLFLRLAPAQIIRVIERPSGKVLREMPLPADLQTEKPADLAIRSSDRHLFAVHPDGRAVVELTLFGEPLRRIELSGLKGRADGLAFDQTQGRLLMLNHNTVRTLDLDGRELASITLSAPVSAVSLGFDSEARHYFVPLVTGGLGEFGADGTLLKTHNMGSASLTGVDAGQRSFVRVF